MFSRNPSFKFWIVIFSGWYAVWPSLVTPGSGSHSSQAASRLQRWTTGTWMTILSPYSYAVFFTFSTLFNKSHEIVNTQNHSLFPSLPSSFSTTLSILELQGHDWVRGATRDNIGPLPRKCGMMMSKCDSVPYIYKRNSTELPPLLYAPVFGLCKILKWNYLQSSMFISWSFLQRLFWWLKILKSMNGGARSMTCSRGPSYLDPKKLKVIMSGQPQGVVFIISDFSAGALVGCWHEERS